MVTLRQLRFLVAVADTLNFSRAAEICFVTQPTLSAGIKELEERLGVQLVERSRHHVMLTPLGAEIAARGQAMLLDVQEIETLARDHRTTDEGELRLGAIPTIGPYLIPQALPVLRQRFPKLKIFLREEITESLIDGLWQGRLDVILIALPFDIGTLETAALFTDGYHLATPPDRSVPLRIGTVLPTGDDQLMLLDKGHCLQRHALQAFPGQDLTQDESFAATSLPTLISMVSEGLGVTLLPDLAVEAGVAAGGAVQLTPLPAACPRHVVLAWRPNAARKPLFEQIADILKQTRAAQRDQAAKGSSG